MKFNVSNELFAENFVTNNNKIGTKPLQKEKNLKPVFQQQ